MKRYDFDWGYVGIEQRASEYGEWVRYVDALAHYSKELDHAYAEGRKDEREEALPVAWMNEDGAISKTREAGYDWPLYAGDALSSQPTDESASAPAPYCAKLIGPCPDGCPGVQLTGCGGGTAGDCWRVKQPPSPSQSASAA